MRTYVVIDYRKFWWQIHASIYIALVTTCPETCSSLAKHIKYEVGIWKILNNSQHLNLSSPGHKSSFLSSAVTASHCHVISVAYVMWQWCEPSPAAVPHTIAPTVSWGRDGGDGSLCVALLCIFVGIDRAYLCPAVAFFVSAKFTFRERRV